MRRGARGLLRVLPDLAAIGTSPWLRAVQTAELLREAYGGLACEELACLAPGGSREELGRWLDDRAGRGPLALVGHEPDLSLSVAWLAGGAAGPSLRLGKGGAALLELPDESVAPGAGTLLWLLRPGQLRELGAGA